MKVRMKNMDEFERVLVVIDQRVKRHKRETHKCTDGSQELRLHSLPFRETTPDKNRIISDLVRDLVCEAC